MIVLFEAAQDPQVQIGLVHAARGLALLRGRGHVMADDLLPQIVAALDQHARPDPGDQLDRRVFLEQGDEIHRRCWLAVLDRYLAESRTDRRPPRFFLNDLIRYWRTICVDFEGKHADSQGDDPKWVSRNAKLLIAGGGEKVTLRLVAEHAQMWNALGSPYEYAHKSKVLEEWCKKIGRDPKEIERTANVTVRSPKDIDEYLKAGLQHFVLRLAHPYETKALERLLKASRA